MFSIQECPNIMIHVSVIGFSRIVRTILIQKHSTNQTHRLFGKLHGGILEQHQDNEHLEEDDDQLGDQRCLEE